MGLVSKPVTFSAGAVIKASEHNSNFDTIYDLCNGALSNANISLTAAIAESKLAFAASGGHTHNGTDSTKVSLAAPGAIGGTTPAAAEFTTLEGTVVTASTSLQIASGVVADDIIDDDTMATASDTNLATAESIKAYVDSISIPTSPTAVTDVETSGVNIRTAGSTVDVCSIAKTITSGNSVILNFSGYLVQSGALSGDITMTLEHGTTAVQTVALRPDDGAREFFSMTALVTGLSGAVTFSVAGVVTTGTSTTVKGNLVVLEIGGN